ncbi:hypothetical protein EGW08_022241 [Elysia chlorotica]|uniref:Uncharacterized protein n=1 Tax=Elysia chlorotica TaxID=188477 RepID=A0A3S1AWA6_ELYCH|nr:hypothetical protein EGW08_022241 [Elysia chlorotica]
MRRLQVISAALNTHCHNDSITLIRPSSSSAKTSNMISSSPLRLWGAENFQYEESPHPSTSLRIPGLTHESFDRDWNPKMTSIMQTSSIARVYAFHTPLPPTSGNEKQTGKTRFFLDWPRLTQEFFTFVSSSEFVMSRALYKKSLKKWPLDMKFTLAHIGTCSIASTSEFFACPDGKTSTASELLWSNTNQFVTVDRATRKATRLPDWYLERYKGKGYMDRGLVVKPFERPAATYAHPSVVQWTDTDNYNHTNWASYVRWATDALHAAIFLQNSGTGASSTRSYSPYQAPNLVSAEESARSALHGITRDIVARGLRKLHISYLRECLQGERVETHVWQDRGGERELVYFSVVRDGEDVCQMKMWYFDALPEEEDDDYPV